MQFKKFKTIYEHCQNNPNIRGTSRNKFYLETIEVMKANGYQGEGSLDLNRVAIELTYYACDCPYYNVYPCILEMCRKLPLDLLVRPMDVSGIVVDPLVDAMQFEHRERALSIRFPEGEQVNGMLCLVFPMEDGSAYMRVISDSADGGGKVLNVTIDGKKTLGDIIELTGIDSLEMRVLMAISLLQDPDLDFLERDICSKDIGKPLSEAVLRRATARKGLGWNLGRKLDAIPHTRRPHWAIRHTGKGGLIPKLVPVKGSIVKRKTLETIPTGFENTAPEVATAEA